MKPIQFITTMHVEFTVRTLLGSDRQKLTKKSLTDSSTKSLSDLFAWKKCYSLTKNKKFVPITVVVSKLYLF